jgi:hypothetical protein
VPTQAPEARAQRAAANAAVDEPCEATVIRRETLRDSTGALLYVAPDVVLARDGELLLAGHATARFVSDSAGRIISADANAFVAAVRTVDGRVHTFAAPAGLASAALRDLRAVSLPNRRWGILFFDQATERQHVPKATTDSLWYGVLGPAGWEHIEALPVPTDIRPRLPMARPMQARGETIAAAVPAEHVDGSTGVLLLEATGTVWRTRFVPAMGLAYTGVAFDAGTGAMRLLAVHPDPAVAPGNRSSNELFLYDPERLAVAPTKLSVFPALPARPAHHPTMLAVGRGLSIAWLAADRSDSLGRRVPTHLLVHDGIAQPPQELGYDAARVISVPAANAQAHVITSHNSHVDSVQVDIHTVPARSRGVRLRHSTTFAEVLGAGRWNDSTVIVTLLNATLKEATSIATEVFWIKAPCSPVSEGRRVP